MATFLRVDGECVSINPQVPLVAMLEGPAFDDRGRQQAKRINGSFVCPRCSFVCALLEDVEEWVQGEDGRWYANAWGTGYGFCDACNIAVHEGFDEDYVIDLNELRKTKENIPNA